MYEPSLYTSDEELMEEDSISEEEDWADDSEGIQTVEARSEHEEEEEGHVIGRQEEGQEADVMRDDEGDDSDVVAGHSRKRRFFPERAMPFLTSDEIAFKKDFRFSKRVFYKICDLVKNNLGRSSYRSQPLSIPQQVAICLNLLGRNTKQRDSARMAGCDQSTVSRILSSFVEAVCLHASEYVFWPGSEERRRISREMFESYNLPNIVGFIDGTQVRIIAPHEHEADYINRKQYHSINVGLICDDKLRFRWINASFPGSAHDSRVFRESRLYQAMRNGENPGCLIGDSAYAAESFLIKVVENPSTQAENRYNRAICAARSHIERAIGLLKSQWKILREECRYNPEMATRIIVACVVLRNIAIGFHESTEEFEALEQEEIEAEVTEGTEGYSLSGRALIRRIITNNFL